GQHLLLALRILDRQVGAPLRDSDPIGDQHPLGGRPDQRLERRGRGRVGRAEREQSGCGGEQGAQRFLPTCWLKWTEAVFRSGARERNSLPTGGIPVRARWETTAEQVFERGRCATFVSWDRCGTSWTPALLSTVRSPSGP